MTTIFVEPDASIPGRYADVDVEQFAFSAVPAEITITCPACGKVAGEHTWQVQDRGRVIDCSEAVAS